jgi:hypothetical protein
MVAQEHTNGSMKQLKEPNMEQGVITTMRREATNGPEKSSIQTHLFPQTLTSFSSFFETGSHCVVQSLYLSNRGTQNWSLSFYMQK